MTTNISISHEPHQWHDPEYVRDWIGSYRTRDKERLSRLRMLAGLIPFEHTEAIHVLDVGAGYGFLSQVILDEFPNSQVVCQDYSEPMIKEAHQRLQGYADRVTYCNSDLLNPEWSKGVPGPFHAVVSSIAIHNVRLPERIRLIYREIFDLVKPSGCFLNAENVGAAGDFSRVLYHKHRLLQMQERLRQEAEAGESVKELEAEQARLNQQRSIGAFAISLEKYLSWLHEAGFDEVDCFWKEAGQAIFGGYRSNTHD